MELKNEEPQKECRVPRHAAGLSERAFAEKSSAFLFDGEGGIPAYFIMMRDDVENINIDPLRIRVFGEAIETHFIVVTNKSIQDRIAIKNNGSYLSHRVVLLEHEGQFIELLANEIPDRAHVLVISPDVFFQSPPQEAIGSRRKLLAMACNSTPADLNVIAHFLRVIEDSDPEKQQQFANRFFELGENAAFLQFLDEKNGTYARFNHLDDSYLWSEQAGTLSDGEQQLAPSGEISVLPLRIQEFDENLRLDFNGTIALNGIPILHNGTPNFLRADQKRLHQALDAISDSALIATVENGVIVHLKPNSPAGEPAAEILRAMFAIDSRYRILWEIGFGINTANRILPGNHAMNETFGNIDGTIHFGLGLTPYTQYHLDIICPNTSVKTDKDEHLIGKKRQTIERNHAAGCPCIE